MKSLRKYAIVAALGAAAVVEAQNAPPVRTLPAAEMRLRSEEIHKQILEENRHVLHLQAVARKEKDVIKLTCINDKLVQMKAQLDLYDVASLQLDSLTAEGTEDPARSAPYEEIEKVSVDVKKLRGEADACAGELEMYKQESRTDVEHPELDDPTEGEPFNPPEQEGNPGVDVPGYATPFR